MSGAPCSRVLIVDDDASWAQTLLGVLRQQCDMLPLGFASSREDACRLVDDCRPDLIVVDLCLDGDPVAGVGVIAHARARLESCDCLVSSVLHTGDSALLAIQAGAVGYLVKGDSPQAVCEALRAVREGGSPLSPRIARQMLRRLAPGEALPDGRSPAVPPRPSAATTAPMEPTDGTAERSQSLSLHEHQMLTLAAKGFTHDEIAQYMGVSRNTVLTYAKRCYRKLQVHSRIEAVFEARQLGLLDD